MRKIILLITICTATLGCTYVSEDDLMDVTPLPDNITYVDNVKSIIDNNCISCHSDPPKNGAPMPLVLFEEVKDAVENRNLIGRITGDGPGSLMPKGGPKLPQNLIDILIQWEADGLLEQ